MRKRLHLKFFSWLLVVVMLTIAINGVCESAHAMESQLSAASDQASQSELSASDQCPCCPLENKEFDDCNTCMNCACHASVTIQQFQLSYNPSILKLNLSEPFKYLPEVFLSKFIPPQKHA